MTACLERPTDGVYVGKELAVITAKSPPRPEDWVFTPANNRLVNPHSRDTELVTPEEWASRGKDGLRAALFASAR
jgi:hypothetical protein